MVVKGTLNGKTIILDQPPSLPAGSRVVLDIQTEAVSAGHVGQSLLAWIEANAIDDPSLPSDLSRRHDHYLYGTSSNARE